MLPTIDNRPITDVKLPVSKKILHIKPYNTAQEKLLLQSMVDDSDKKFWLNNIQTVLKQNMLEDYKMESALDFIYLTMKLRSISKGQIFEYNFPCQGEIEEKSESGDVIKKKCKHVFREADSIDSLLNIKNRDVDKIICDVNEKVSLELIPPIFDYFVFLSEMKDEVIDMENENAIIHKNLELFTHQIAYCVSKVMIKEDGQIQTYTEFTIDELINNIISNFTSDELQKLYDYKSKLINMSIKIRKCCPKCKSVFEKEDTNFFTYLV